MAKPRLIDVASVQAGTPRAGYMERTAAIVVMAGPRGYTLVFGGGALEHARRQGVGRITGYVVEDRADTDTLRGIDQDAGAPAVIWRSRAAASLAAAGLPLRAIGQILEMSGSHAEAQRAVNLGRRLDALPDDVRNTLGSSVRPGHLRYLAATSNEGFIAWCRRIVQQHLTVIQLRAAMRGERDDAGASADLDAYANSISAKLGANTKIHWPNDPGGRRVEITWYTPSDLQAVFAKLAQTEMENTTTTGSAKRLIINVTSTDDITAILGAAE